MRPLKELYRIVSKRYKESKYISFCICNCITYCRLNSDITDKECDYLRKDLYSRRPSEKQYTQFWDKTRDNRLFWWNFNDIRREEFLKYLIETV